MEKDSVVLIHGLGGSRLDMWPIGRRLRKLGFQIHNWGYRSVGNSIPFHIDQLKSQLRTLDQTLTCKRLHVVAHSMGGIIARVVLQEIELQSLGRFVMLAPPNRGSHFARKIYPWFGWLTASLEQLSDQPGSYVRNLPNSLANKGIEFGIVEASKDRVIERGTVGLPGQKDFAIVNGQHGILPWYSETSRLVENFLTHGEFETVLAEYSSSVCDDEPPFHWPGGINPRESTKLS